MGELLLTSCPLVYWNRYKKGNCLLVISYIHEGYVENNSYGDGDGLFEFFDELHHVIDKNKIPPSQILFLISNHKLSITLGHWSCGYSQGSLHNFSYQKPINVMKNKFRTKHYISDV